jgi:hypothetical protein
MMFFFKTKKIVIDCFTDRPDVFNYFPIQHTSKFFPDWWKKLPNKPENLSRNMKSCLGFNNYFSKGITLSLWSDLSLIVTNIPQENRDSLGWLFSDSISTAELHSPLQFDNYLNTQKYKHLKLMSPWLVKCKEDMNWVYTQNTWLFDEPDSVIIPPGIVDFKYQSSTNINLFMNLEYLKNKKQLILESGMPIVNMIPMSDRNIEIKKHLITTQEFINIKKLSTRISFHNSYIKIKKNTKDNEKKCPFGFTK